jgi:hypothetical protein
MYATGGIRTCNSSKRVAAEPYLRPCGHWDQQIIGLVNNKLARLWKEAVMALFEVLPQAMSGGTEQEN